MINTYNSGSKGKKKVEKAQNDSIVHMLDQEEKLLQNSNFN